MKFNQLLTLISFILLGCSTTSSYIPLKEESAQNPNCNLDIVMVGEKPRSEIEVIGNFSVKEMGLSVGCGWEDSLAKNKKMACERGAEGIQFLMVSAPSINSTCYQTQANFFIYKK